MSGFKLTWVTMLHDLEWREAALPDAPLRKSARRILDDGRRLTLRLPQPLVVYADPELAPEIEDIRAGFGLASLTRVVPMPLEATATLAAFSARVAGIDASQWHTALSPKDTPLYHLLTWTKLEYLEQAAREAPFGSSHVGWIDFGLAHALPATSPEALGPVARAAPDAVRLCWLKLVAPEEIHDQSRTHLLAAGLMTAAPAVWLEVAACFRRCLERSLALGVPRLEEVILASVWSERPELFARYWGWYSEIVANYVTPTAGFAHVFGWALVAFRHGRQAAALEVLRPLLESFRAGTLRLAAPEAMDLLHLVYSAAYYVDRRAAQQAAVELRAAAADPFLAAEFETRRPSIEVELAFLRTADVAGGADSPAG
jgi:hypothetical protein